MKNPLRYQMTEFDCGPTALLNGISCLFEREEIPPEVVRSIMIYSLDSFDKSGAVGKRGTSDLAMMFLANWLNSFGKTGQLPVSCRFLSGDQVFLGRESYINDTLCRNGVVILRVFYEYGHYVLITGEREGNFLVFDPYYDEDPLPEKEIVMVNDHPKQYNRIAPAALFDRETMDMYAMGPIEDREAVLLFNENTKLTPEETIEYFI